MVKMQKENISLGQLSTLTILFLLGSAIVIGIGSDAQNDAWIAQVIALFIGVGVILFYYKFSSNLPEKNLFQIFEFCFGRKISIILSIFYVAYFIYISCRVLRDFGELITTAIMPNTPIEIISVTFSILMGYIIYLGLEVFARTSEIFTPYIFLFFLLLTIFLFASGDVDIQQIKPILGEGFKPVIKAIFPGILTFPYGEFITFMVIFPSVTAKKYKLRVLMISVVIAALLLIISSLLMICTIGVDTMLRSNFPLLSVARNVSIGNFIERIDALVVFIMMLTLFVKSSIYFFAALKGLEHVFRLPFRYFAIPSAMIVSLFSVLISVNFADHIQEGILMVPKFLHIPFQFILPIIVFMVLLWKKRKNKFS